MTLQETTTFDVLIIGAGPVGLLLACELRLWGVRVLVAEQLARPTGLSKALSIQGRGVELLALRGLLPRFQALAMEAPQRGRFARIPLAAPMRFLAIHQAETEALLRERAAEVGVEVRRGLVLDTLRQDDEGVTAIFGGPGGEVSLRARYLVGCDGGRSRVRERAQIAFPGEPPTSLLRLGDVKLAEGIGPGVLVLRGGAGSILSLGDGWFRATTREPYAADIDREAPMTVAELEESVERVHGSRIRMTEARWLSRFTDSSRQAEQYRSGRVFLAGDAAHVHMPAGGPGLSTGFNDAANLGWKLAGAVQGWASPTLLDSYHAERHPAGARVLLHTRAQTALMAPSAHTEALRQVMAELCRIPGVEQHLVAMLQGSDVVYDLGQEPGDPLVGRWAPDLEEIDLRAGRGLLVGAAGGDWARQAAGWADRVAAIEIAPGRMAPDALLVRPDGHVAWASTAGPGDLPTALRRWFGEPGNQNCLTLAEVRR
jgi:2-polyprenyl-6-methoxyphenol hydroxylase-like FAD-dependent oxidoreductase